MLQKCHLVTLLVTSGDTFGYFWVFFVRFLKISFFSHGGIKKMLYFCVEWIIRIELVEPS